MTSALHRRVALGRQPQSVCLAGAADGDGLRLFFGGLAKDVHLQVKASALLAKSEPAQHKQLPRASAGHLVVVGRELHQHPLQGQGCLAGRCGRCSRPGRPGQRRIRSPA